jgi:hypothetical protein
LNIGLFETIIFTGVHRGLDLAYLNPLLFYHSFQLNENSDENTFLGMDVSWYVANQYKLFGQLMFDDYQIDNKELGDKEPNEIGYIFGFHGVDILNFCDIKAEYLKISNRTYNQNNPANRYLNRGGLIGNEFGPDGDRISFSMMKWFNNSQKVSLNVAYQRKGEGRYDDDWEEPWLDSSGEYSEPFPTGVAEKKLRASLELSGFLGSILFFDIETGVEKIKDSGHIDANDETILFFSIKFALIFSTLLDIE